MRLHSSWHMNVFALSWRLCVQLLHSLIIITTVLCATCAGCYCHEICQFGLLSLVFLRELLMLLFSGVQIPFWFYAVDFHFVFSSFWFFTNNFMTSEYINLDHPIWVRRSRQQIRDWIKEIKSGQIAWQIAWTLQDECKHCGIRCRWYTTLLQHLRQY